MLTFLPFILIFGVYLVTVCPTVYLGDSGELTAAAFCLGVPHNSGYPLYVLLGKLFCLIPLGHIGFRMNLMSCFFGTGTVWFVCSLLHRMTSSNLGAFIGALVLAFTPLLWLQTISAEVYTLHAFFVALLLRLLWWWDEKREFHRLLIFAVATGVSFGNHLQTVMLAPAVLFLIFSGDKRSLLDPKQFVLVTLLFIVPLLLYLVLPIRTLAEAPIHWGDPDTLDRFLAHVTGKSHRAFYVFTKAPWDYFLRTKEGVWFLGAQFAALLIFASWGWLKLASKRWKIFFLVVVLFDFVYTIFLNIISIEITPFNLPSGIVLCILIGVAIAELVKQCQSSVAIGSGTRKMVKVSCWVIPLLLLLLNFDLCDQSRNYTAYEQAVNVFRTTGQRDILFMNGDNYVFPVTYARIAEGMRDDVTLYDRLDIIFRMPNLQYQRRPRTLMRETERNRIEKGIMEEAGNREVYYAVFGPYSIEMPDKHRLIPYGVLHRVVQADARIEVSGPKNVWSYYSTESFYENLQRDFMNREMCAFYHFSYGKYLILSGSPSLGLKSLKLAAEIGHNDTLIHSDMAVFLTDHGFFQEARQALGRAMLYHEDLSGIYNNWGYYYHRMGDYKGAVDSFKKAVQLRPDRFGYYNNLGYALYELGDMGACEIAFRKSLAFNDNQPDIKKFMRESVLRGESNP